MNDAERKIEDLLIWSDDHLLVINKPAGLSTLTEGWDPAAPYLKAWLEAAFGRLWVVHRLDKDTSGVLVMARSAEAHRLLNTQFEGRQVLKMYHALVVGMPPWQRQTARHPLRTNVGHKHRTVVDPRLGKPSITHFQVLERYQITPSTKERSRSSAVRRGMHALSSVDRPLSGYCLIEAHPETGRTHQIRVHLSKLGCPLAGDLLYGGDPGIYLSRLVPGFHPSKEDERPLLGRVGLHARLLNLSHPISDERLEFSAPYPPDLENALKHLRRFRADQAR